MDAEVMRDMKNIEKGALITFDTSSLKDSHYFAGMDDSESYSLEAQSNFDLKESADSEGVDRQKVKKFHKSRCKAWITSVERIEDRDYYCVIFVEADDNGDIYTQTRGLVETELKVIKQVEMEDKKVEENSVVNDDGQDNKQEEEIRHIKDSRAMLNEKKNSKSIKTLQKLFIAIALICIGSEIFLRVRRSQSTDSQNSYVSKFLSLFNRNVIMTDIGYYLRKYERIIKYANVTLVKTSI